MQQGENPRVLEVLNGDTAQKFNKVMASQPTPSPNIPPTNKTSIRLIKGN